MFVGPSPGTQLSVLRRLHLPYTCGARCFARETSGLARTASKHCKEYLDPKKNPSKNGFLQNCASLLFFFTFLSNSFLLPTCRPPVRLPVVLEIAQPNSKAEMSPQMEYKWKIKTTRCRPPKFGLTKNYDKPITWRCSFKRALTSSTV